MFVLYPPPCFLCNGGHSACLCQYSSIKYVVVKVFWPFTFHNFMKLKGHGPRIRIRRAKLKSGSDKCSECVHQMLNC